MTDGTRATLGFLFDKATDFLIAFAGLFLAIYLQDRVEQKKEQDTCAQYLDAFATELKFNKDRLADPIDTSSIEQTA